LGQRDGEEGIPRGRAGLPVSEADPLLKHGEVMYVVSPRVLEMKRERGWIEGEQGSDAAGDDEIVAWVLVILEGRMEMEMTNVGEEARWMDGWRYVQMEGSNGLEGEAREEVRQTRRLKSRSLGQVFEAS
jgi:hypothetical protein